MNAHKLPPISEDLRETREVPAEWHIPGVADYEAVGNIVIRSSFLRTIVVIVSRACTIVETKRCLRLLIDRFSERVATKKTQRVGEAFLDFCLQGVISRAVAGTPI